MNTYRNLLMAGLMFCLTFTPPAFAAPRIAITQPAIHSLVVNLMQGIGEPDLVLPRTDDGQQPMDPFQVSQLLTADLVIWIGAGLEPGVAQAMERFPSIENHATTLSNTLPLMLKRDFQGIAAERQLSRDLAFWNDPKLAIMAVKQITPKLVLVDPENTERYLDNEITVIARIRKLHHEMADRLSALPAVAENFSREFSQYFTHRFLTVLPATGDDSGFQKVASRSLTVCPSMNPQTALNGKDFYFASLTRQADRVMNCAAQTGDGGRLAVQQPAHDSSRI